VRCVVAWLRRWVNFYRETLPMTTNATERDVANYWTRHNVTLHHAFASPEDSLEYLAWRNDQYFDYITLMPLNGVDGMAVLDFGCGPGHDLVGFGTLSRPRRLVGAELSPPSLSEARIRLALHGIKADLVQLDSAARRLPFDDAVFDYVHSSGVIHHTEDPEATLREFARVLKPGGRGRIMVYNRDSVWYHLYVPYVIRIIQGRYADLSLEKAFAKSTDGEDCPISRVYAPPDFVALAERAGLGCRFLGAAISAFEGSLFHQHRFTAIMDRRLPTEARNFVKALTMNDRGLPVHGSTLAGIDGCYEIHKPT
jgi:SAM-dependent methyltransferase